MLEQGLKRQLKKVLKEWSNNHNTSCKKQVKNVVFLFIIIFLFKNERNRISLFSVYGMKSEWKCGCVGMEWRIRRMNGGREVHKPPGQIFSPQILL